MAVFEKAAGARRLYSHSSEEKPTSSSGIGHVPTGSMLTHTDTGDRFIYNADEKVWHTFIGTEDVVEVLEVNQGLLQEIRDILAATHHGHEEHLWEEEVEIVDGSL